jgi:hypothetical protein
LIHQVFEAEASGQLPGLDSMDQDHGSVPDNGQAEFPSVAGHAVLMNIRVRSVGIAAQPTREQQGAGSLVAGKQTLKREV